MKFIKILVVLIHGLSILLTVIWNLLAVLTEVFVNDDDDNGYHRIGNHWSIGGNEWGDDTDIVKRAGNHYIDDQQTALYRRHHRH